MDNLELRPAPLAICLLFVLSLILPAVRAQDETPLADTPVPDSLAVVDSTNPPAPVTDLEVRDLPNDGGGQILATWQKSADDVTGGNVTGYTILRSESPDGPFEEVGDVASGATQVQVGDLQDGKNYYFKVVTAASELLPDGSTAELTSVSPVAGPAHSSAQWFDLSRVRVFVATFLVVFFILYFIRQARKGQKLYIRKIAGLEAVDEAVGRATEMGRKIYFVPGIQDMDNVQTIAGVIILGHVAELAAQYETFLEVPVCRSLVLVTAKEVLKEAYTKAGRPDSYQENQVHYLTDDQFGYAAAIDGMVVREKPATIFYMGAFFAESLILAETGNAAGAIQIAGTAMPAQLPFFVTACDYTLIGEELFAASAYLSKEPKLLGSLKGQDYAKAVILVSIIIGVILETFGIWNFSSLFKVSG
jgi:hypothetical protein